LIFEVFASVDSNGTGRPASASERGEIGIDIPDKTGVPAERPMAEGDPVPGCKAPQICPGPEVDGAEVCGQPLATAAELNDERIVEAVIHDERAVVDDVRAPDLIVPQAGTIRLRERRSRGLQHGAAKTGDRKHYGSAC
jgi:hypothetical protein